MPKDIHPATLDLLSWFDYDHLNTSLAPISKRFHDLAHELVDDLELEGAELSTALRKLLEGKDAAVRARIKQLRGQ